MIHPRTETSTDFASRSPAHSLGCRCTRRTPWQSRQVHIHEPRAPGCSFVGRAGKREPTCRPSRRRPTRPDNGDLGSSRRGEDFGRVSYQTAEQCDHFANYLLILFSIELASNALASGKGVLWIGLSEKRRPVLKTNYVGTDGYCRHITSSVANATCCCMRCQVGGSSLGVDREAEALHALEPPPLHRLAVPTHGQRHP